MGKYFSTILVPKNVNVFSRNNKLVRFTSNKKEDLYKRIGNTFTPLDDALCN